MGQALQTHGDPEKADSFPEDTRKDRSQSEDPGIEYPGLVFFPNKSFHVQSPSSLAKPCSLWE